MVILSLANLLMSLVEVTRFTDRGDTAATSQRLVQADPRSHQAETGTYRNPVIFLYYLQRVRTLRAPFFETRHPVNNYISKNSTIYR